MATSPWRVGLLVLACCISTAGEKRATAQPCAANWLPGDGVPGVSSPSFWIFLVYAATVWDSDGPGPQPARVVVGGSFSIAGNQFAKNIAVWDIETGEWSTLGTGLPGDVYALAALPDGRLIAGGSFTFDGATLQGVAQWDGTTWSPLGDGLNDFVNALAVMPSGEVIACGGFTLTGPPNDNRLHVARWDGSEWHELGEGQIRDGFYPYCALCVSCDGRLFAGRAGNVAEWDGASWRSLAGGTNGTVGALAALPTGEIVVGGYFSLAGGVPAQNVAMWNGQSWAPMGFGLPSHSSCSPSIVGCGVHTLTVLPNGRLAAGGYFNPHDLAEWDGTSWQFSAGVSGYVLASAALPDGSRVVGGGFSSLSGYAALGNVARVTGSQATPLSHGTSANPAYAALVLPNGDEIIGGSFNTVGGVFINNTVARHSADGWSSLGTGVNRLLGTVYSLALRPDGVIAAGGTFGAATWNGTQWKVLGGSRGLHNIDPNEIRTVLSLAALPNGDLIAGGWFRYSNFLPVNYIARWNGTAWSALGSGLSSPVWAVTVMPNGDIVAGGQAFVSRWDGTAWTQIGSPTGTVYALGVAPNGDLVAAGSFEWMNAAHAKSVAAWDGSEWHAFGDGISAEFNPSKVLALTILPSGEVVVGGDFLWMNGVSSPSIAAWNGSSWRPLGMGMGGGSSGFPSVNALATRPEGGFLAAGDFLTVGGLISPVTARFALDSDTWGAGSGGAFTDPASWSCGHAPQPTDRIIIDAGAAGYAPGSFQITLPTAPHSGAARATRVASTTAKSWRQSTDAVTLDLNGSGLLLTSGPDFNDPALAIGDRPAVTASLTLRNSSGAPAALSASTCVVGEQLTSPAQGDLLHVQGGSARLELSSDLYVARRADRADCVIDQQASAVIHGGISVATEGGAVGELRVLGGGASLSFGEAGQSVAIGQGGAGTLRIGDGSSGQGGATATSLGALDALTIGTNPGSGGAAVVSGAGSYWAFGARHFSIGNAGNGAVTVEGGGAVATTTTGALWIARAPGSTGLAGVSGPGSSWIETLATLHIGQGGELSVTDQGYFSAPGVEIHPGGALSGNGVVGAGSMLVRNQGVIAPSGGAPARAGDGIGTLTINGDLAMCAAECTPPGACCVLSACTDTTATACFDAGGSFHPGSTCAQCVCATPGQRFPDLGVVAIDAASVSQTDQLIVTGTAHLNGSLVVNRVGTGFDPVVGQSFEFLHTGTLIGTFGVSLMPPLTGNRYLVPTYNYTQRSGSVGVLCQSLSGDINLNPAADHGVAGLPAGAVLADFDGFVDSDGHHTLDLAISVPDPTNPATTPGSVVILRNAGTSGGVWQGFTLSPSFTITVGRDPRGLAAGRFNGDGALDLAVCNAADGTVSILMNNKNGTGAVSLVQTVLVGAEPVAIAAGAIRTPGLVDLVTANRGSDSLSVLNNNGAGGFAVSATLTTDAAPAAVTLAQLDDDADVGLDIAAANQAAGTVTVYFRQPGGGYSDDPSRRLLVGNEPGSIEPGQIDNGKDQSPAQPQDLVVANRGSGTISFFLNNGTGGFGAAVSIPAGGTPESLALGDLDGDGDPDIAVVTTDDSSQRVVRVLRNDLTQTPGGPVLSFTQFGDRYAGSDPRLVRSADVDDNGRADLVVVNSLTLVSRPDGSRGAAPQPSVGASLSFAAPPACATDLSGDGVTNTRDLVLLLLRFGQQAPAGSPASAADINADGHVDGADLMLLLLRFGQACR